MLKMKKSLGLILTAVMFAGCTTVVPQVANQNNTTAKVEAVKVDPIFDLGEKNGATAKINLKFNKESKFGIKGVKGFMSGSGEISAIGVKKSYIVLKLHGAPSPATFVAPNTRFDTPSVAMIDGSVGVPPAGFFDFKTTGSTPLTFKGLKFGWDYSVSLRAYVPANVDVSGNPIDFIPVESQITITTGVVALAGGAYPNFNLLQINPGDIISIGANRYSVTGLVLDAAVPPNVTGLNVVDFATGGAPANVSAPTGYNLWRNVVSSNGTPAGVGGGTQGAINDFVNSKEEVISVSPIGVAGIINDDTPGNPGPADSPNTTLDISVQLMKDLIPTTQRTGGFAVLPGTAVSTATEMITSP